MRKRKNRKLIPIFWILAIMGISLIFSTTFAMVYATNSNVIANVKINNMEVSGLSQAQIGEKLEKIINEISEEEIILKHGEIQKTYTLKQMELETNIAETTYNACKLGRSGNIFANNFKIIDILINGENLKIDIKFNEEILKSIFNNLGEEWEGTFIDNSYYIDGDKLVIVKGKEGIIIDENALRQEIVNLVNKKIEGEKVNEIEIPTITNKPSEIDLNKIQKEIYKEPKNASYDKTAGKLSIHSDGIDFGVSIEEAKEIIAEDKEECNIPLKITKPEITTDMLGEDAFPNTLGSFSTRYDASNKNRGTNIELAAEAINGTVLLPGEKFSFNSIVGPTTAAKGYKLAGAYAAGELVENYGGGICQVSSTIYNAVLCANLEIIERYNHSSVVSYVDPGLDATISYGSRDLKFKNPRKYAVRINAKASNGILDVEIKGIYEEEEYEIELSSETTEIILCNTKYVYDSSLAEGQEIVKTGGANGAKSISYKTVKKNGRIVLKTELTRDSYNPMTKVILTGSKSQK